MNQFIKVFVNCLIFVFILYFVLILTTGCSISKPPIAPPVMKPIAVIETKPKFEVTEKMIVDSLNRDTMLLYKIDDMNREFDNSLTLIGNVLLLYKEELEKIKSCECKNTKIEEKDEESTSRRFFRRLN